MLVKLRQTLESYADKDYREFNIKTNPAAVNSLGVRMPILRKLAKELTRDDFRSFLSSDFSDNFEEKMIRGLVIASADMSAPERIASLREFVPTMRDWGTCDALCSTFKIPPDDMEIYWNYIREYENSAEEFEVRFMFVMMLQHFLTPKYQAQVLNIVNENKNTGHFAEMAAAWLIAESFVINYAMTKEFMLSPHNKLTKFVYNKGLAKARESYRITATEKAALPRRKN